MLSDWLTPYSSPLWTDPSKMTLSFSPEPTSDFHMKNITISDPLTFGHISSWKTESMESLGFRGVFLWVEDHLSHPFMILFIYFINVLSIFSDIHLAYNINDLKFTGSDFPKDLVISVPNLILNG